jgi:hypothetical protein
MGYNGLQIGIISAVRPFIGAACAPLFAAVADCTSAHRSIFLGVLALSAAVRLPTCDQQTGFELES